jgi:hypothetical protein
VQQIDQKRQELESQVSAQITQLGSRKDAAPRFGSAADPGAHGPASMQVDQFCAQIEQAAASAATSASGVIASTRSDVAGVRQQAAALGTQLQAFENDIGAAQAELT